MKIHKVSIRAILFRNGSTKKQDKSKEKKLQKRNALPSFKEITRNRTSGGHQRQSLKWIFRK